MAEDLRIKLLTDDEVGTINKSCIELLSSKGIKLTSRPQVLKMLDNLGAHVDYTDEIVKFPKDIILEALRTVPQEMILGGRKVSYDLSLPHPEGLFYVRGGSGTQFFVEPRSTAYRKTKLSDVIEWAQLVEVLDEINICTALFPQETPRETTDMYALRALFENTGKHILIQPYGTHSVEYLFEMGLAIAGNVESFKQRPPFTIHSSPIEPLTLKGMHVDTILQSCQYGAILSSNPISQVGATSPVTMAGTVLQSAVSLLSIVTISQMIKSGTPVIGHPVHLVLDMKTGGFHGDSIEALLGLAASVQFIKEAFHIPVFALGFTGYDSYALDGQLWIEVALRGLMVSMARADVLMGAGRFGIANSSLKLIIDNSLTKILKRSRGGIRVDEDTLARQVIIDTPQGGHYLEHPHTLKHCRDATQIDLFATKQPGDWRKEGSKDLDEKAIEEYYELKKNLKPYPLSADVKKELDKIVKMADQILGKESFVL